ncbi:nucleophile aminohydrolase [Ochromonadaceae sp. CCMP2298]|nr:nucleophile aminohydrolase [Ochromonadaceae sp. CCMP2298]
MLSLCSLLFTLLGLLLLGVATPSNRAGRARYDKNVNLFSASGELLQVQYARNAGLRGASVLCCRAKGGEVLICVPTPTETQQLLDRRGVDKVARVSEGIWLVFAGLAGDGRSVLKSARSFCIDYKSRFGQAPSVRSVARFVGEMQHESTLAAGRRPLGVQVLLIGAEDEGELGMVDANAGGDVGVGGVESEAYNLARGRGVQAPALAVYLSEPSGELSRWKAVAVGQKASTYNKQLEGRFREDLAPAEAARLLARIAGVEVREGEDAGAGVDIYRFHAESAKIRPHVKGMQENFSSKAPLAVWMSHYGSLAEVQAEVAV